MEHSSLAVPTGSFTILTVRLKRHTLSLFVCFGWRVRGGYSCSSYLSTIIIEFSSPLRVPRPWSLHVRPFWLSQVNFGWKIGTITETGLPVASMTAFQTSIVRADFSAPPESFLISPFCAPLPLKIKWFPPKFFDPSPPHTHTCLKCSNKRPGHIFDCPSREAWARIWRGALLGIIWRCRCDSNWRCYGQG